VKLSEVAEKVGGSLEGDSCIEVRGVAGITEAGSGEISFIANPRYAAEAAVTKASAVIVSEDWSAACPAALIRTKNPDEAFAKAAALFYTPVPRPAAGIHPSAVVAADAEIGADVFIGALSVVESGAKIGAGTVIMPQCYIGRKAILGSGCWLYPQVSLREEVRIGNRSVIHNGTVIGSDGFGYSVDGAGVRTKIPQIGIVEIGDDVEIGANVTIDRARFGKTRIGNGVKIDNLVQIAHNVTIGDHSILVAMSAVSGSTHIGNKVIIAGQAGLVGHIRVGDGAIIGAKSAVTKDVEAGAYMIGIPALPAQKFKRSQAAISLLPKLKERIAALDARIRSLETKGS
jgi:UDP-3-O-[3-hydroxymyristoyl] glucosamine N-acyltransferase